jgi:hypothetical protein
MDKNAPVTKKDLSDLEDRIDTRFKEQDTHLKAMEARLVEKIRDSQTELLRGFEKFQTANFIRMRKLEANLSNLDTASSMRLENLEERLLEIEKKLLLNGGTKGPKN